jgi:hypothetical protein
MARLVQRYAKTIVSTSSLVFVVFRLTFTLNEGIGPKITQSVITAAFLFAFKDALYDMTVKARRKIPAVPIAKIAAK